MSALLLRNSRVVLKDNVRRSTPTGKTFERFAGHILCAQMLGQYLCWAPCLGAWKGKMEWVAAGRHVCGGGEGSCGYRCRPVGLESCFNLQRASLKKGHPATRHIVVSVVKYSQPRICVPARCPAQWAMDSSVMVAGMEVCKRPTLWVPSTKSNLAIHKGGCFLPDDMATLAPWFKMITPEPCSPRGISNLSHWIGTCKKPARGWLSAGLETYPLRHGI